MLPGLWVIITALFIVAGTIVMGVRRSLRASRRARRRAWPHEIENV